MNQTIDEDALLAASLDVSKDVIAYIDQFNTNGVFGDVCSEFFGVNLTGIDSICELEPVWGYYNCSNIGSSTEALCALLRNPNLNSENPALQLALLEASGLSVSAVFGTIRTQVAIALDSATESLYPDELWMLTVPLGFGITVAILTALQLAISYIPSVTTTIIQLRTGVIPSLGDSTFERYRVAPDTITLLTGTLFWGCLVSSILSGMVIATIVFLLLWQGSQILVERLIVIAIGLTVIIILRLSVSERRAVSYGGSGLAGPFFPVHTHNSTASLFRFLSPVSRAVYSSASLAARLPFSKGCTEPDRRVPTA